MNPNSFVENKAKVIEQLSNIHRMSIDSYNEAQKGLSNNLFTAATAYIAIILTFTNNVHEFFGGYSWVIAASIFSFSASLIPWIVEKILASTAHGKTIAISSKLSDMAIYETWDEKSLEAVDKIAVRFLHGGRTSLAPITMQIIFFSIGVLFAVAAIAMVLL